MGHNHPNCFSLRLPIKINIPSRFGPLMGEPFILRRSIINPPRQPMKSCGLRIRMENRNNWLIKHIGLRYQRMDLTLRMFPFFPPMDPTGSSSPMLMEQMPIACRYQARVGRTALSMRPYSCRTVKRSCSVHQSPLKALRRVGWKN